MVYVVRLGDWATWGDREKNKTHTFSPESMRIFPLFVHLILDVACAVCGWLVRNVGIRIRVRLGKAKRVGGLYHGVVFLEIFTK